jgi:cell division protease FtsH
LADPLRNTSTSRISPIIDKNYQRARDILTEHVEKLHAMAKALMKYETLGDVQIKDIMEGREPTPPEDWDDSDDSEPTKTEKSSGSGGASPIGGPASEH